MCGPGKGIEAGAIHDGPPGCGRYSRFTVRKVTVRKRAQRYREKWPLLLSDIGIVAGGPVPDAGGGPPSPLPAARLGPAAVCVSAWPKVSSGFDKCAVGHTSVGKRTESSHYAVDEQLPTRTREVGVVVHNHPAVPPVSVMTSAY